MNLAKTAKVALFLFLSGCGEILSQAPDAESVLAEPLSDLSEQELNLHIQGDEEFAHIFTAAQGLGPLYNQASCETCHIGDGKGHPSTSLSRFGRYERGVWDPLLELGGPQLQDKSIAGFAPETRPAIASGFTTLLAPNVTGLGYLEAVTDATLINLADPDDLDNDGISGRVHWIEAPDFFRPSPFHSTNTSLTGELQYIGRFGRKASTIDLLHQTAGAYVNDMGITSDLFLEDSPLSSSQSSVNDFVADPEIPGSTVASVAFYLRTLKAPPRRNANDPEVLEGERIFTKIGCTSCHVPALKTGPSPIALLDEVEFYPYSDLLLHDMGPELDDGYQEQNEKSSEWRTTPLWGLGLQRDSQGGEMYLMHDGRASTFAAAIKLHGGEAATSATAYNGLREAEKNQLDAFLESL